MYSRGRPKITGRFWAGPNLEAVTTAPLRGLRKKSKSATDQNKRKKWKQDNGLARDQRNGKIIKIK